jgi:hypothetical protein
MPHNDFDASREKRMAQMCRIKNGFDPPVCAVHNLPLVRIRVSIDRNAPSLGEISCLRCPASHAIVSDRLGF